MDAAINTSLASLFCCLMCGYCFVHKFSMCSNFFLLFHYIAVYIVRKFLRFQPWGRFTSVYLVCCEYNKTCKLATISCSTVSEHHQTVIFNWQFMLYLVHEKLSVYGKGKEMPHSCMNKASHLTAFLACNSNHHLQVIPAQLMRLGISQNTSCTVGNKYK